MKNFLIKIISILVFSLIIILFIEILFRGIPNNYSIKFSDLDNNQIEKLEGIYFGSSHTLMGINPEYSKIKSFNLANISQTIDVDNEIFEKKLESFKKLKTVFVELSYFSLGSRIDEGIASWRNSIYDYYLRDYPLVLLSSFPSPLTSFKSILSYYILKKPLKINSFGHQVIEEGIKDENSLKQDATTASLRHFNDSDGRNKEVYIEFIRLLRSHDISVVVHIPPVTKEYKEVFDDNQRVFVENFLEELKNKFEGIDILDNSSLFENRYDLFSDSDHLNTKGANEYTKFLNKHFD